MDREVQPPEQDIPQSNHCGTDKDILPTLLRYRDQHRWSWNLSMRLINLYYGTHFTEKQLKSMYKNRGA